MEYALRVHKSRREVKRRVVLILVVMEYALRAGVGRKQAARRNWS